MVSHRFDGWIPPPIPPPSMTPVSASLAHCLSQSPMKLNARKLISALVAILVVTTGVAAAATFDTETTTTGSESDISGSTNTIDLYLGNSSQALYVETDGASTSNLTLNITPAETGVDTVVYTNSTPDTVNDSNGHYAWNITHDELEDIPRDESGGTFNVTITNESGTEILSTEVTFNTPNDENAVMLVTDGGEGSAMTPLVADSVEITSEEGWYSSKNVSTWSGYTTINGSESTVTVDLENSSTADAYASAAEGVDDGEWMTESTVWINGVPHKVYKNEFPDDVDSDQTTVVYDNDTEQLTVNPGSEYADTSTVSIRATGNEGYGFGELWSNFGATEALGSLW